MDKGTADDIYQDMLSGNAKRYYVITVSAGSKHVAVDNIGILDAAIKAKIPKIRVINLGKADPLLTHIEISSNKETVNPVRVALAVHSIKDDMPEISLNSYLQKVLAVEFDDTIMEQLADMIDYIFEAGIKQPPPLSYFAALSKLDDTMQKTAIAKTQILCQELKQRYFVWPNTHVFSLMLFERQNTAPKFSESASKDITEFNCKGCGAHYGIINNEVCQLEEKNGCLAINDRLGTVLHMIPAAEAEFLGIDKDHTPRFSKHQSIKDLGRLDLDGPFLLVRL